jgi:hypothetical protein
MNTVKLMSDSPLWDCEFIIEQANNGKPKKLSIRGPFLVAEERNGNGRMYKTAVLEKAVEEFRREKIEKGLAFGETNHPDSIDVNYERACIKVDNLIQEGNIWIGEATVLASFPEYGIKGTVLGDNLASIIQYGGKPGVSSRGVGQIGKDKVIDEVYKLIAEDVVHNPSGPGCYVDGILESKCFMIDNHGDILEASYDRFEKDMHNLPRKPQFKADHIVNSFNTFLEELRKLS